jgi:hypothetical protein
MKHKMSIELIISSIGAALLLVSPCSAHQAFTKPYDIITINHMPGVGKVSPKKGSATAGKTVFFKTTWFDDDGWLDLDKCYFQISKTLSQNKVARFYYNPENNKLYLLNSKGKKWLGGYKPGSTEVISNNQTVLHCEQTKVVRRGNLVRVKWAIAFESSFQGEKNTYLSCEDKGGLKTDWAKIGAWNIEPLGTEPQWSMFMHDPQHTGRTSFVGPENPKLKWKFETPGKPNIPAIGSDGTIYLPVGECYLDSLDYFLYAINPDGKLNWRVQLPGPPDSTSPAISKDGTIYIHCSGPYSPGYINITGPERMLAISPAGATKWIFEFGTALTGDQSSPILGNDGTIYVGSKNVYLYAIKSNGKMKWALTPTLSSLTTSPALTPDGSTLYVYDPFNWLFAFTSDGEFIWSKQLSTTFGGTTDAPVVGPSGNIYLMPNTAFETEFYAFNPTGKIKWSFDTGYTESSTPAIGPNGTIYLGTKTLFAINPDGSQRWKFEGEGWVYGETPIVDGAGTIYWSRQGPFYAINPNGKVKWEINLDTIFDHVDRGGHDLHPVLGKNGNIYLSLVDWWDRRNGALVAYGDAK